MASTEIRFTISPVVRSFLAIELNLSDFMYTWLMMFDFSFIPIFIMRSKYKLINSDFITPTNRIARTMTTPDRKSVV